MESASSPYSTNVPGSSSVSMRSRTGHLPRLRWRSICSGPPIPYACSRLFASSASSGFQSCSSSSGMSDPVPNVRERHEAGRYRRALMSFTVAALVVGVVLGYAAGGSAANVNRRSLELVWLLAVSVLLQAAAETLDLSDTAGLAMVLVSYVGL